MNKSHREGDKSGRDVGLIGERTAKVSGYDTKAWHPVDKMLKGDHPTTHMGTVACAGGQMGNHHNLSDSIGLKEVGSSKGNKKHFAAGGIGKQRKGEY